jgi:hypothetical protein
MASRLAARYRRSYARWAAGSLRAMGSLHRVAPPTLAYGNALERLRRSLDLFEYFSVRCSTRVPAPQDNRARQLARGRQSRRSGNVPVLKASGSGQELDMPSRPGPGDRYAPVGRHVAGQVGGRADLVRPRHGRTPAQLAALPNSLNKLQRDTPPRRTGLAGQGVSAWYPGRMDRWLRTR